MHISEKSQEDTALLKNSIIIHCIAMVDRKKESFYVH